MSRGPKKRMEEFGRLTSVWRRSIEVGTANSAHGLQCPSDQTSRPDDRELHDAAGWCYVKVRPTPAAHLARPRFLYSDTPASSPSRWTYPTSRCVGRRRRSPATSSSLRRCAAACDWLRGLRFASRSFILGLWTITMSPPSGLAQKPTDALLVGPSPLLNNRRVQIVTRAPPPAVTLT